MPEPAGPSGAPRRNPRPALLTSILGDTLDPGYAEAAARRGMSGPPPARRHLAGWGYLVLGVLAVGLVLGIAARATAQSAPSAERTRAALLGDVHGAQQRIDSLEARASVLDDQVRSAQAKLGATGPLATVSALERAGAMLPVQGPGLRVVVDMADDGSDSGVVLDADLQLLVNGLWASGAEAVSVGGVRLRGTSTIRQAGGAILVDNTPVFWPLTIDAIGDPSALHVSFVSTEGFGRFAAFASLYDIRFDVTARTHLTEPAAPGPDLRFATALTSGG